MALALCGALLYGVITYRARNAPFTIPNVLFIALPAGLLLKCFGATELPPDSFFNTIAFYVIVNAILGAIIFLVVGNFLRLVIRLLDGKGDHNNE